MDSESPKFRPKTPSVSGLTRAPNRGTQQRLRWKSAEVDNEANAIVFDRKIVDLKFSIWTFKPPKFHPKTPSGSGLTSAPNRGTQQGFSRFYRLSWKSERVENEANAIVFDRKIADLKFSIWTFKPPNFIQKLPREVG